MRMNQMEVLSKEEILLIHDSTLDLLETIGIKVESSEARNLLKKYGADIDKKTNLIRFPEYLVKEQLKKAPNSFKIYGPDGSFNFEVNTYSVNFATVGTTFPLGVLEQ